MLNSLHPLSAICAKNNSSIFHVTKKIPATTKRNAHCVNLMLWIKWNSKKGHKDRFSSSWFSVTTVGTKWLSVIKSPAMMLTVPSLEPGICSFTQLISLGLVDITRSFRDSVGCVQMYFRSTVRFIPVTKKPSDNSTSKIWRTASQTFHFQQFFFLNLSVGVQYSSVPGLSCFFRFSKASMSASALHLLAHQYGMCGHNSLWQLVILCS